MPDDPDFNRRDETEESKRLTQDEIKRWIEGRRPTTLSAMVIRDVVARHEDGSVGYRQWVGGREGFLESEPLWGRARQLSERQNVPFETAYTHIANKVSEILDEPRITTEQAIEKIAQQETSSLMHRITGPHRGKRELFQFGGARAATADVGALDEARRLETAGTDPKEIWKQTGWYKRADGWRFEIDDSRVEFKLGALEERIDRSGDHEFRFKGRLGDLIEERGGETASFLKAYPHLADAPVTIGHMTSWTTGGGYNPKTGEITVSGSFGSAEEILSLLMHEAQHAIQHHEGFATGGNETTLLSRTNAALYDLDRQIESLRPGSNTQAELEGLRRELRDQAAQYGGGLAGFAVTTEQGDAYERLRGEVEGRNTQGRLRLSAEERRAVFPGETEDIPREEQYDGRDLVRLDHKHGALIDGVVAQEFRTAGVDGRSTLDVYGDRQVQRYHRVSIRGIEGVRTNILQSLNFNPQDIAHKIKIYGARALADELRPKVGEFEERAAVQLAERQRWPDSPRDIEGQAAAYQKIADLSRQTVEMLDRIMTQHPELAGRQGYVVRELDPDGLIERYSGRQYTKAERDGLASRITNAIEDMRRSGELSDGEADDLADEFDHQGLDGDYGINKSYPEQFARLHAKHKDLIEEYRQARDSVNYQIWRENVGLSMSMDARGFPLSQRDENEPLGRVTFFIDRTIIELFQRANSSTLIHEWMGHVWVEELLSDARRPDAPEWLQDDARTVYRFVGAKEGDPLTDEQHEMLARTMERYTREGRAPSRQLEAVFIKFREWMLAIYRRIRDLDVPINDEIRGVFDRMLATAEDIAEYRGDRPPVPEAASDEIVRRRRHRGQIETTVSVAAPPGANGYTRVMSADHCQSAADVQAQAARVRAFRARMWTPQRSAAPLPETPSPQSAASLPGTLAPALTLPALPATPDRITVHRVLEVTADHFGLTVKELLLNRRTQPLAHRRQVAMYVARELTGRSLPFIASKMGKKDHTTILDGHRAVKALIRAGDGETIAAVDWITARLTAPDREQEHAAIAARVADMIKKAERPREEAETIAKTVADRYVARAAVFGESALAMLESANIDVRREFSAPPGQITVRRVLEATADHFGLTVEELVSDRRTQPLARRRQVAMYVAREMTGRTLPFIARRMGKDDHTTIIHGVRVVKALIDAGDSETIAAVDQITARLTTPDGEREHAPIAAREEPPRFAEKGRELFQRDESDGGGPDLSRRAFLRGSTSAAAAIAGPANLIEKVLDSAASSKISQDAVTVAINSLFYKDIPVQKMSTEAIIEEPTHDLGFLKKDRSFQGRMDWGGLRNASAEEIISAVEGAIKLLESGWYPHEHLAKAEDAYEARLAKLHKAPVVHAERSQTAEGQTLPRTSPEASPETRTVTLAEHANELRAELRGSLDPRERATVGAELEAARAVLKEHEHGRDQPLPAEDVLQPDQTPNQLGAVESRMPRSDIDTAVARLSAEAGLPYTPAVSGEYVAGVYRQSLTLTSGKFAMIDNGLGFALVPWTQDLDRHLGRHVAGVGREGGGVEWSFGRKRGLEI
jgi:hypothetical protein